MRCLTSQHWSDTLRVTVKASSYSEAVCVSYIPVVPITTTVTKLMPAYCHSVDVMSVPYPSPPQLVRVFSDVLVAFPYFDICHYIVANIKVLKSHLNIREGSDYTPMNKYNEYN